MISSLVVETVPERTEAITETLEALAGVEVHDVIDSRIAITIETETVEDGYTIAMTIPGIPGVTGTQLVYANFE